MKTFTSLGEKRLRDINKIANEARASISSHCMNVCQAKCCRRGFLVLMNKEEVISIVGDKELEFSKEKILKPSKNGFLLYDLEKKPCKNLKSDLKCGIHKNPNRPRVCGDYPLFIFKDYVMPAEDCSAVKAGLLDHYVKEIEGLGYKKF